MTRQTAAESTELQPLPVNDGKKDGDQSSSSTTELEPIASSQAKLHQGIWRRIVAMRWREIVTASIIMMNLFLICASISLIGIFFPTEVRIALSLKKSKLLLEEDKIIIMSRDSEFYNNLNTC